MDITLGNESARLLQEQIASGRYVTVEDVICDALRLLAGQQTLVDDLNTKIDRGLDDVAAGRTHSPNQARALLRDRRAARTIAAK